MDGFGRTEMADTSISSVDHFSADGVRRRGPVTRTLIGDIQQFADFVTVIIMSILVAYFYHIYWLQTEFDFQYYAAAGIIGATGLTALLRRDGYYEFDQLLSPSNSLRAIVSRWFLVILGLLAFGFALKISENFSRVWLFAWTLSTTIIFVISRYLTAPVLKRLSQDGGVFARRIAVVGATMLGQKFSAHISEPENGLSIVGVYRAELASQEEDEKLSAIGDINDLAIAARNGEIDDIVLATPRATKEDMSRLIRRLSMLPVSISMCPNAHWLDHTGGEVTGVGNVNVLSLYRRPLDGWGGIIKNVEDFVLGAIILVLLSPVLLIISLLIKLQGKGPILFAQQRHGFNNAVFKIYKFRTMTVAEDGGEIRQAQLDDPRITPLGKILRRYSLDELPQLLNVIRGEMSLVGPRPHALAHNHQYARTIENYSGRHKVKPGITGWAQVNGYRGETSENEMMEQRVKYDLAYVDNWSLWFDLKILFMTVNAVVFPKNAV